MKVEQQQFLALLRAGLWDTSVDTAFFSAQVDWMGIVMLASDHTLKGIVAEAINKLPVNFQPPQQLMRELLFYLSRNRIQHAIHNAILAELIHKFVEAGIYPVLLKGQGVALNYPDSTLRHCGDIDLYIGTENFERSVVLARQCQDVGCVSMLVAKHYGFYYKGVSVELHRIVEALYIPWRNVYLQHWTKKHLQKEHLRLGRIDDKTEIFLPPYQFDVVYILEHAWHHYVYFEGIGLRQICDWAEYLHQFHNKINMADLEIDLKKLGLWKAWKLFGYIAVNYLGLPQSELSFYDDSLKSEADVAMQQILVESYGQEKMQQVTSDYIGRKLRALRIVFGKWKVICRYEGIFNTVFYLVCFLFSGVYRMLRYWRSGQ